MCASALSLHQSVNLLIPYGLQTLHVQLVLLHNFHMFMHIFFSIVKGFHEVKMCHLSCAILFRCVYNLPGNLFTIYMEDSSLFLFLFL
jgi:hypothetical protein